MLPREYLKETVNLPASAIWRCMMTVRASLMPWWLTAATEEITQYCDSFAHLPVEGLGTPVGSLLVGNRDYIKRAIRWRKMAGGGMRQSGILAAAGMYALKNNVARLQEDHDNAAWMARQLREAGADVMRQDTIMLFVRVGKRNAAALGELHESETC